MENLYNDINFIKSCYSKYNLINEGKNIPDFSPYFDPEAKVIFNNVTYNFKETIDLINIFCKNMNSVKVNIIYEIECLDQVNRSYLVLSNWECETVTGQKDVCPMMEIIDIKNDRIIKAIGVIHMGILGNLLTDIT